MDEGMGFRSVFLAGAFLWGAYTLHHQGDVIAKLRQTVEQCSDSIDMANQSMEDVNKGIEDAKADAGSDYETMGLALDGLKKGETVANTCSVPTKE